MMKNNKKYIFYFKYFGRLRDAEVYMMSQVKIGISGEITRKREDLYEVRLWETEEEKNKRQSKDSGTVKMKDTYFHYDGYDDDDDYNFGWNS